MTITITAPAPLFALEAPLPAPRDYTLLDVAQSVTPENNRWLAGAWAEGYPPGLASVHDPCSTGTGRAKAEAGVVPLQMDEAFTVYLPGSCTAQSIGPDPQFWTDRLRLAFQAVEAEAVERVFALGGGILGHYLGDPNMENLSGAAVSPDEGLSLLEQAIGATGIKGIIHADPATASAWGFQKTAQQRGLLVTNLGTPVAVGAGYIGVRPDDHAGALAAGTGWAFASGPIAITRTEVDLPAADYAQTLDRAMNDVVFIAERHYLINWVGKVDPSDTDHVQAGVLIDRTP